MASICLTCKKTISKQACYGLHVDCFTKWFELKAPHEFNDLVRQQTDSEQASWCSSFFQGKFRKYSASLSKHDYILKVEIPEAPELADVEFLCNQIAEELNIVIPKFNLIQFDHLRCFVTRNFISEYSGGATLDHIYHFIKSGTHFNCAELIKAIIEQTHNPDDVTVFINICLLDALIGNHDRHGRNLGFITNAKGSRLAPAYDNTSALGLESSSILKAQFNPKGKIFTKSSNEPTIKHYAAEFNRLGYKQTIMRFYKIINIDKIDQLIENSTCTNLMKNALKKLIHSRYQELSDAL